MAQKTIYTCDNCEKECDHFYATVEIHDNLICYPPNTIDVCEQCLISIREAMAKRKDASASGEPASGEPASGEPASGKPAR